MGDSVKYLLSGLQRCRGYTGELSKQYILRISWSSPGRGCGAAPTMTGGQARWPGKHTLRVYASDDIKPLSYDCVVSLHHRLNLTQIIVRICLVDSTFVPLI